jgi:hypothetical protein
MKYFVGFFEFQFFVWSGNEGVEVAWKKFGFWEDGHTTGEAL